MTRKEEINQAAIECCGAEEEWQPDRMLFAMGAEWADKTIIDKACEWLTIHDSYSTPTNVKVENFRKAMKGE